MHFFWKATSTIRRFQAPKVKVVFGPFKSGKELLLSELLMDDFRGSIIYDYVFVPEFFGDLCSCEHTCQEWAAFYDDFVEVIVIFLKVPFQKFTGRNRLFNASF